MVFEIKYRNDLYTGHGKYTQRRSRTTDETAADEN